MTPGDDRWAWRLGLVVRQQHARDQKLQELIDRHLQTGRFGDSMDSVWLGWRVGDVEQDGCPSGAIAAHLGCAGATACWKRASLVGGEHLTMHGEQTASSWCRNQASCQDSWNTLSLDECPWKVPQKVSHCLSHASFGLGHPHCPWCCSMNLI